VHDDLRPVILSTADRQAVVDLSIRYARAADRRDTAAFLAVFTPDALLTVLPPDGQPARQRRGHDELGGVTTALSRYRHTFHLLGQADISPGPAEGTAAGEVYCEAHHLQVTDDGTEDRVMYIRYADEYTRTAEGWRIAHRLVQVDWTDTHSVR
jgi:ketosteroid isomerase-like protein